MELTTRIGNLGGLQQISEYKTRANLKLNEVGPGEVVFICGCSNMLQRTEADGTVVHFDPEMNFVEEDDDDYRSCANGGTIGDSNRIQNAYTASFGPTNARKLTSLVLV